MIIIRDIRTVVFQSNTKVLTLNLQDNWLGTEGGLAVCEMLKDNCFITDLVSGGLFSQYDSILVFTQITY